MKNLRRRIERLEAATSSDFQTKLRLLLARMISSNMEGTENLIEVASQHEAELSKEITDDGNLTWPGLCRLIDLGAFGREAGD
jgi:hypothetical protein